MRSPSLFTISALLAACTASHAGPFINFESPHVHPLDLSPDGALLAACNTPDGRVELFDVAAGTPVAAGSVAVGYDPVTVRFRSAGELWVVNHISDSISVVDVASRSVIRTIQTADEPADVVFAGDPVRAFVTCSSVDQVWVFDPDAPDAPLQIIAIEGEDPRALAASPDGATVYAAIFESGNATTILGGGLDDPNVVAYPPNAVSDPRGPWGGQNPPPNHGDSFLPALNPAAGAPPPVALIVKRDAADRWLDDNGGDWTALVSGPLAEASGRPVGWELIDHDVAVIDAATGSVSYIEGLMNLCMAIGVNPATGDVSVAGTEALNHVRFEPNVNGIFVRSHLAIASPGTGGGGGAPPLIADLNPHLDYATPTIAEAERERSLGDPRAVAWAADGSLAYVAGLGSANIVSVDATGARVGSPETIEVGDGPTGLALDESRGRLYSLNRFDASVSAVDTASRLEIARVAFHDPTPEDVKEGRHYIFDSHLTSGLGQASCASCHVDARTDRLSWDLGDPSGAVKALGPQHNLGASLPIVGDPDDFTDFHPMKGPMLTQTLQDIIGQEPHHWRGDRDGIEEFNGAFMSLLGDDELLDDEDMAEMKAYLQSIYLPPNPFRNLDNSLAESVPLPGQFKSGRFGGEGDPLPNGNARRGFDASYRPLARGIDRGLFACATCHTLPTGGGTDTVAVFLDGQQLPIFEPIAPGPNGERHHALISVDGSSQRAFKIAQLRTLYDRVGFDTTQPRSRAGFGFLHDGSVDSLARFFSEPAFNPNHDQEIADLVALMMSFSGSGFGPSSEAIEAPGTPSQDAHAAVGAQVTLDAAGEGDAARLAQLLALADAGAVEIVARAAGRGWLYLGGDAFAPDEIAAPPADLGALRNTGSPVTFTAVPAGTGARLALDRDDDGIFDFDESRDLDPETPGVQNPLAPANADAIGDAGSTEPDGIADAENDSDGDGQPNGSEILAGTNLARADSFFAVTATERSGGDILISFPAAPGRRYTLQAADTPGGWQIAGDAQLEINGATGTFRVPAAADREFFRVLVNLADG